MTLIAIILATLASGIGSVWLAAFLLRRRRGGVGSVGPQHLLGLAGGAVQVAYALRSAALLSIFWRLISL